MRTLAVAAVAAVAGVIALTILFPRYDPSVATPMGIDRAQAEARVRQMAMRYGVDTTGWQAAVSDQTDAKLRAYKAAYPADPAAALFGVLRLNVTLIQPGGPQKIRMVLFGDGRPAEWFWEKPPSEPRAGPTPEMVLTDFTGTIPGQFVPNGESDDGGQRYDWDSRIDRPFQLVPSLKMEQKAGVLRWVTLRPVYRDEFEEQYKAANGLVGITMVRNGRPVSSGMGVLAWIFGLGLFVRQVFLGRVRWRLPLTMVAVCLAWGALSIWGGTYRQEFAAITNTPTNALAYLAGEYSGQVFSFFWSCVFVGARYGIRSAGNRERWYTFEEFFHGRIFKQRVGESLAVGLLSGIALAAVPYLVAAMRWLPGNAVDFRSMDALIAPVVPITAIRLSAAVPLIGLFGCFLPFLRYLRRPVWFWMAAVPVGVAVLMDTAPFRQVGPVFATALLLFGGYLLLYLKSDLLAVGAAAIAARAAIVPWVLWWQPLPSIRANSLGLVTLGAVAIAGSVYWALRGSSAESAGPVFAPELDIPRKPERERLQAEFQVARKAQQDALPTDPPLLNGYTMAGWCEPAQQVGGDLYDFFPLPDGRMGIAVADVSGKGVPAALYMMLTKGLLVAASRDSSQLQYILEQINLHLYRACRKKVFVTMAAVVLDAAGRRMEYGRAGHNPVVWRRARRGETTLVKPTGLGLGMTPGERFNRSLRIEELELEADDAIVLYSDGVTEAINENLEQYGEARLMRAVESADGHSAAESRDAILRDLAGFMGTTPPRDDITLVVVRV